MRRVDAHVHAFPDRLALAVRGSLNSSGALTGGVLLPDVAQLVRDAGFDAAWILPYAHRAGIAESVNEWSAREVQNFPWLIAGATFHPDDADLDRLVERALVGLRLRVVKLHCSVGQFSPADPRLVPLWRVAADQHVPVIVHAGRQSPGETSGDEVEELAPVLAANPDLHVVLAHTGFPSIGAALDLMERFDNLYADITPVWDHPLPVGAAELRRFPGRFLFGSDAPNSPLSAKAHESRCTQMLLTADEADALMGGTADRLLS